MADLIIVHPVPGDLMRGEVLGKILERDSRTKTIYMLEDTYGFPTPNLENIKQIPTFIDPETFRHVEFQGRRYSLEGNHYAPQRVELKRKLIQDKVQEAEIFGQSRTVCVQNIFDIVTGITPQTRKDVRAYIAAGKYLGIDEETTITTLETPIKAKILEHLCH
jgi:hypothetical protein